MIRLPGVCIVCRQPVVWTGNRSRGAAQWREIGPKAGKHVCRADRPTCGAWMPLARERCARRPGHWLDDHRTTYSMENRRVAKSWTRTPFEPHIVDGMTPKNLNNGAVKASITEVPR